jgi:hypothetical protein
MTLLHEPPSAALDESAHEFISTFMSHVATVVGYGENRLVTLACVKSLLLAALTSPDAALTEPWRAVYRAITEILAANGASSRFSARLYLEAFLDDNGDLASA